MDLRNNTILLTGGTSGLGLEFATRLVALGNTVLITGRDPFRLAQTQQRLPQVHTFRSDVSDPAAIASLHGQVISRFPALNMLINNAGEMRRLNLRDPAVNALDVTREIDINLAGPIRMVQQFLPHLQAQKSAAILNVSSGLAVAPYPLSPVYGATKAGLHSYTQSLRVQLGRTRVKVFELLPPSVRTPLNDKFSDIENNPLVEPEKVVAQALKGLENDTWEIYPGMANALRIISRIAPGFLLKQFSKGMHEALARPTPTKPSPR